MAKVRELRKRIKSVRNTKKITKTMEMVATAKFKRALDRVKAARPYAAEVSALLASCATAASLEATHPLVRAGMEGAPDGVLVFTANRGLCGGFNSNMIKRGRALLEEVRGSGCRSALSVVGKKGIGIFRFEGVPILRRYTRFDDKPSFAEAREVARDFSEDFRAGKIRSLRLVYTSFKSAGEQKPIVVPVLPVPLAHWDGAGTGKGMPPLTSPEPGALLERLLPLWLSLQCYRALVESAACEQVARRVAMKAATDNADEMIKSLSRDANRARQSQITQEIAEIVGGTEAIQ
jgi:F-type H+-transporting ATPase subunit gamma